MEYFEVLKDEFESALADFTQKQRGSLWQAMNYSLLAGGKRLRPVLFLGAASLYGVNRQQLMDFALGIEMIHTYSLIHDDLPAMDNDDFRRGKPTNHKVYGEAMAILAGDALLTEAFHRMAITDASESLLLKAIGVATSYSGSRGMVLGQVLDIEGEGKSLSLESLKNIHYYKTGRLITLSLLCGAILGGASDEDLAHWEVYGENLGLAFQIVDDILDATGTFETLGKPIGSDAENHKVTYLSLLGAKGAEEEARKAVFFANESIAKISKDSSLFQNYAEALLNRKI